MHSERQRRVMLQTFMALQLSSLLVAHSSELAFVDAFPPPSTWRRLMHVQKQQQHVQNDDVDPSPYKVCAFAKAKVPTTTTTTSLSLHRKLPDLFGKSDDDKKKTARDKNDKSSDQEEATNSGGSASSTRSKNSNSSSGSSRLGQNVGGVMESMGNFKNAQKVGQLTQNLVQDLSRSLSEGTAAEGRVRVVLDGQQRPVSVKIDASYFEVMLPGGGDPSGGGGSASSTDDASLFAEELSSAITAAMQRAHAKSVESIDEKMKSLYNELGIPSSK